MQHPGEAENCSVITPDHLAAKVNLPLSPLLRRLAIVATTTQSNAHLSEEWLKSVCMNGLPVCVFHRVTEETRKCLNSLLSRLLAYHAPWLESVIQNFEICLTKEIFIPMLNPWEEGTEVEDDDVLNFLQWLTRVGQSCSAAILCASVLLGNAGALLAMTEGSAMRAFLANRVKKLYTDRSYLDGTWSLAADTAAATPQTFAEEWDAQMAAYEHIGDEGISQSLLQRTKMLSSCVLSVSPTELIDVLFRRALIREFTKGVENGVPFNEPSPSAKNALMKLGPVAIKSDFLSALRLGINLGLAKHQISVLEESKEVLRSGDLFMVDCYTMQSGGKTPPSPPTSRKLRNSLAVGQAVLYSEDRAIERDAAQNEFLDCLEGVRGRAIGFVTREPYIELHSPIGHLVEKGKERAFPRLFAVTGGWPALKLEILQLPAHYHDQLLVPAYSRPAWPLDSFGQLSNSLKVISDDPTVSQVRDNVKAFLDRESETIAAATHTLTKRMWKFFATTGSPSGAGRRVVAEGGEEQPQQSSTAPGELRRFETVEASDSSTAGIVDDDKSAKILSVAAQAVNNWWGSMTSSAGASAAASSVDIPSPAQALNGPFSTLNQRRPSVETSATPAVTSKATNGGELQAEGDIVLPPCPPSPAEIGLDMEDSGEEIDLDGDSEGGGMIHLPHALRPHRHQSSEDQDGITPPVPSVVNFEASGVVSPPVSVVSDAMMIAPHPTFTGEATDATVMSMRSAIATESAPPETAAFSSSLAVGDDLSSLDDELAALEKDLDQRADACFKALGGANKGSIDQKAHPTTLY